MDFTLQQHPPGISPEEDLNAIIISGFHWCWKPDQKTIYIGGDSGYDSHFRAIGNKFGGFDLAILECGQYHPYWKYIHMLPEETAQAADDLNAKKFIPVHWKIPFVAARLG